MLVIGLTGPTGAGKSVVSEEFAARGIPILNADEVYHALLIPPSPCLDRLTARFGSRILNDDGSLNRPSLGRIVFSDPKALADLNAITHGYVLREIRERLAHLRATDTPITLIDAPQLFEAGGERDCTTVISVLADADTRLARIMERDGIDRDTALRRMASQKSDDFFRAHSDYIIENNGDLLKVQSKVRQILDELGGAT